MARWLLSRSVIDKIVARMGELVEASEEWLSGAGTVTGLSSLASSLVSSIPSSIPSGVVPEGSGKGGMESGLLLVLVIISLVFAVVALMVSIWTFWAQGARRNGEERSGGRMCFK